MQGFAPSGAKPVQPQMSRMDTDCRPQMSQIVADGELMVIVFNRVLLQATGVVKRRLRAALARPFAWAMAE